MGVEDPRYELVQQLPEELRFVYKPDSPMPDENYLRMVVGQTAASSVNSAAVVYPIGLTQSGAVRAHTGRMQRPEGGPLMSVESAERIGRFRAAVQRLLEGVEMMHVVTHASLAALPPDVRQSQLHWLLDMPERTGEKWLPKYVPPEAGLPPAVRRNLIIADSRKGEGVSAYEEGLNRPQYSGNEITAVAGTTSYYYPLGSEAASGAKSRFYAIARIALPVADSQQAFERMR